MVCHIICIVGYIILMLATNDKVKIFGTCLITTGVFPSFTIVGAWTGINIGGFTKRAITWAVTQVVGQCFPSWRLISTQILLATLKVTAFV